MGLATVMYSRETTYFGMNFNKWSHSGSTDGSGVSKTTYGSPWIRIVIQ